MDADAHRRLTAEHIQAGRRNTPLSSIEHYDDVAVFIGLDVG